MSIKTDFLPEPFRGESYSKVNDGIYDDPDIKVFMNSQNDFAFLFPQPQKHYQNYEARYKKLKLKKPKNDIAEVRLKKIASLIRPSAKSLLEIGASDGAFLKVFLSKYPKIKLAAVEPDENSWPQLSSIIPSPEIYSDINEVTEQYDIICLFHVLEHILNPGIFLKLIGNLTHSETILIIEVPSLFDPLLSIYDCKSYASFYFQSQHPYIYSHASLLRLMEYYGFHTIELINYQRYGIDNHLNWLSRGTPGGDSHLKTRLEKTNRSYISELEEFGKTDSVIWVGKTS